MQLTVKTKDLLSALQTVGVAIKSRSPLPILSNIKLECTHLDCVSITATDLNLFVQVSVEARVKGKGSICVPHGILSRLVPRITSSEINLELKESQVVLTTPDFTASIDALNSEEFPPLVSVEDGQKILVAAENFLLPLRMVQHAIGTDESRYILMGVNMSSGDDGVDFAATNNYQISVFRSAITAPKLDVIIPDDTVDAILKTFSTGEVTITVSQSAISVMSDDRLVVSRLVEGKFPSYRNAIPKPGDKVFSCKRSELIEAIQATSLFLADKRFALKMTGKKKQIELSCEDKATAKIMGTDLQGQPDLSISFNRHYMTETLNALTEDEVRIECSSDREPMLIREGKFTATLAAIVPPK